MDQTERDNLDQMGNGVQPIGSDALDGRASDFDGSSYHGSVPESAFSNSASNAVMSPAIPEDPRSDETGPTKKGGWRGVARFALTIVAIIAAAFLLRMFVFQSYEIPSGSMEDTIMPGDLVFAEKVTTYFAAPEKGAVITFEDPETIGDPDPSDRRILIKRVIATGGQTIDLIDGDVYVDGVKLDEPYTDGKPTYPLNTPGSAGIEYPYLIPAGHLWMMGDNRTSSQDSRYFGAVPVSYVQGHALFIYWPLSDIKAL